MDTQCSSCSQFYMSSYPHYCPATKNVLQAIEPESQNRLDQLERELKQLNKEGQKREVSERVRNLPQRGE